MRREGRLHGYEFDREAPHKRVKACNQATNRSKIRSKYPQEKAGRPGYKALKKIKGQRNKGNGADMAANHNMHNWALHTRSAPWLADSREEADVDPSQQALPCEALRALLLAEIEIRSQALEEKKEEPAASAAEEDDDNKDDDNDEDEEKSNGSDWLDLGSSTDGSDDDWYLC